MCILQSAGSLGRIVGPVLGGYLFGAFGMDSPFYVAAGVIGIMKLYLLTKREYNLSLCLFHSKMPHIIRSTIPFFATSRGGWNSIWRAWKNDARRRAKKGYVRGSIINLCLF